MLTARVSLACSIISSLLCSRIEAASIPLAWNPTAAWYFAGYHVHYGLATHDYTTTLDAGTNWYMTVNGLAPGFTYFFAVTAYDGAGLDGDDSDEIEATTPFLPFIISQPSSQFAQAGATTTVFVGVVGQPPILYQWFFGATPITAATNSILRLPQLSEADAGDYSVVITDSNGSVTSAVATVTVIDPPSGFSRVHSAPPPGSAPLPLAGSIPLLPLSSAAGTYNGLFYQTDDAGTPAIAIPTAGLLSQCTVDTHGHFTGAIYLAGNTNFIAGVFDDDGNSSAIVDRASAGLSNLDIALHLDLTSGTLQMSGVVSNLDGGNPWTALLAASLQTNAPAAFSTLFLAIPPAGGWPAGSATATESEGIVWLSGTLGDGAAILQTAPVSRNGNVAVFVPLYHNAGLLAGWLNVSGGAPISTLTWICPAGGGYPGFTNVVQAAAEATVEADQ
jgi:hypothetical protein